MSTVKQQHAIKLNTSCLNNKNYTLLLSLEYKFKEAGGHWDL